MAGGAGGAYRQSAGLVRGFCRPPVRRSGPTAGWSSSIVLSAVFDAVFVFVFNAVFVFFAVLVIVVTFAVIVVTFAVIVVTFAVFSYLFVYAFMSSS